MTKMNKTYTPLDLKDAIKLYIKDNNRINKVSDAIKLVEKLYNEKEFSDCIQIAMILTGINADENTIIISLITPLFEHELIKRNEIEDNFGSEVASLVYCLSKLNKINFSTENEYLVEYYKKIIVGMSDDVKVIIIKLSYRLYEMRNLWDKPVKEQKNIAKETLEILTPLAHHLGIHKLKSELEDLSLRYLKPDVFYDIATKLNSTKVERDNKVKEMIDNVSNILIDHNIKFDIKGRSKSIYSIYNKLDKGKKFSDIYDLLALRVLVEKEQECYLVLGLIHSKYKPLPKRFKDYIAMPKKNGYQSLHTTIFGDDGNLFEIQIRTHDMNEIAENGVASHWSYKENNDASKLNSTNKKLEIFKSLIEEGQDLSMDLNNSGSDTTSIYAFTPKGDVIELPVDSTPIDFAYKVHTKIGEMMTGAIVNNSIVPLNYKLQDNDIVKIITNSSSKGPSKSWIKMCKNTQTKNKIKSFFTKSNKQVFIEKGKYNLEKLLRKNKINFNEFYHEKNINKLLQELKLNNLDEIYLSIGNNKYNANTILEIISPKEKEVVINKGPIKIAKTSDITVSNIENVKVNLASCCAPVKGDELIGYITKNNGISVHVKNCHNLSDTTDRLIDVSWNEIDNNLKYLTYLLIEVNDPNTKIFDIMKKLSTYDINVETVNTIKKGKNITYALDLYVHDLSQLNNIIDAVSKLKGIEKVGRIMK